MTGAREIVVFGREPVPGRVKTRLAAAVGEAEAARIYRLLLEHTVGCALATGVPVTLSLAEAPSAGWSAPEGVRLEVQAPGNLGERMGAAFGAAFARGAGAVVLVGSDCPGVRPAHLAAAFGRLGEVPVVLGPAADGGYWLVGQRAPGVDCFSGVPWSSERTLEVTRRRLEELGVAWAELGRLRDVDTLDDLERLLGGPAGEGRWFEALRAHLAPGDGKEGTEWPPSG